MSTQQQHALELSSAADRVCNAAEAYAAGQADAAEYRAAINALAAAQLKFKEAVSETPPAATDGERMTRDSPSAS